MSSKNNDHEEMMNHLISRRSFRRRFLFKVPFILAAILLKAAVVMWLWNLLVPELFHGPLVHYGQAFGLMILAKLLVGFHGFGRFGGGRGHCGPHERHHAWKHRWMQMTPEERENLRAEFKRRWRGEPGPTTEAPKSET